MKSANIALKNTEAIHKGFTFALWLAALTIGYNIIEGLVAIWFGASDEALTLFGFGVDSFIETISAAGIFSMIIRIKNNETNKREAFEKTALRITGGGFYVLAAGLTAAAIIALLENHKPQTTLPAIIIAVLSIGSMWLLVYFKRKTGRQLNSDAIIADANCNLVCIYMSVVLLVSGLLYTTTGFGSFDALGAAGLAWFSVKEGRESFEKAKGKACTCH